MANLREETLNTYLATLLDQYDGICATPEIRDGREAIDITVTHSNATAAIPILIEAKIGDSAANRRKAAQQARSRLSPTSQALAWGLCYPTDLRDGSRSAQATQRALAEARIAFAPVPHVDAAITWREGTVVDLANTLLNTDLSQERVADAIEYTVRQAAALLFEAGCAPALADALALPKTTKDLRAATLIASLMLSNAALLHHRLRLVERLRYVLPLKDALEKPPILGQEDKAPQAIRKAWEDILRIDYYPVFAPALAALNKVLDNAAARAAVRVIAQNAVVYADELASLRFDHAGPLYHRLLASAKYDGSFYTNNVSALLLARLALDEGAVDWGDASAIAKLKVIDPACGTGTLLMAAMHAMRDRHEQTAAAETDLLHLTLVEDVLYGLDINRHGIQLAACNLTLGNPRVDYSRMNLFTMRHGPQADGVAKAGSVDILATAKDETDLASLTSPLPTVEGLGAEQVELSVGRHGSLAGQFDLVIMNPPFTRNDIRNRQYDSHNRRAVQEREIQIAQFVRIRGDELAFRAIDQTSIETFFAPLADTLLKDTGASLAMVNPTTALTGASASSKRKFLADRFQIETVITSHDPRRINFSENTSIHESLMIARRPGAEREPTRFISLARMPRDAHEAILLSDLINGGKPLDDWGTEHAWPWPRIRDGDWSAAQFYDGALADAIHDLAALAGTGLRPAGELCYIEPEGRRVRDAFLRDPSPNAPWTAPILWDHETNVRVCMDAKADVVGVPKPGKETYARFLTGKASRLLIANRLRTNTVRTAACYAEEPLLGSAWCPVRPIVPNPILEQALCAWWNSTPGILTLLHCRAKALDYPRYALDSLRSLLIPDSHHVDVSPLADAFEQTRSQTLLPWPQMAECPGRAVLDQAAARVLRMNGRTLADWRERIAAEPTVSGEEANRPRPT